MDPAAAPGGGIREGDRYTEKMTDMLREGKGREREGGGERQGKRWR